MDAIQPYFGRYGSARIAARVLRVVHCLAVHRTLAVQVSVTAPVLS